MAKTIPLKERKKKSYMQDYQDWFDGDKGLEWSAAAPFSNAFIYGCQCQTAKGPIEQSYCTMQINMNQPTHA